MNTSTANTVVSPHGPYVDAIDEIPWGADAGPYAYGPRGWTMEAGIWPAIEAHRDRTTAFTWAPRLAIPIEDHVRWSGLTGRAAADLAQRLPAEALAHERQNLGPTLGVALTAAANHPGQVILAGYAISPRRRDERVTADTVWVATQGLPNAYISPTHGRGCQCETLWPAITSMYGLDAQCMPDEITQTWIEDQRGWHLWWD